MPLNVDLLRSSFALVADREPELALRFYDTLFSRYPQARRLFRKDEESQAKMLTEALVAVIDHLEDAPWLTSTLGELGAQHVAYGVTPQMYGWVAESMLATLSDVAGAAWTPALAQAWTDALNAVAGLMLEGARKH
jgi:hemoglobin-like flavoprotein